MKSPSGQPTGDRGSVLMLMPAAVLIVMVMGSIAVDAAIGFQAQREAVADAQAVAHDIVSAVSPTELRSGEDPQTAALDDAEVARRANRIVHARRVPGEVDWQIRNGEVTVRIERRTELIFRGAVPGVSSSASVSATATAVLARQQSQ